MRDAKQRYPHALFGLCGTLARSTAFCGAKGCYRACLKHLEGKGVIGVEKKVEIE